MKRALWVIGAIAFGWTLNLAVASRGISATPDDVAPMIVHNVYFSCNEKGAEPKKKLVAGCQKYLADHPGVVYFAAGARATEFERPVNDQDFDVALHMVFKDKAAHDKYQESEKHKQFITEFSPTLVKVRVFDSKVTNSKLAK